MKSNGRKKLRSFPVILCLVVLGAPPPATKKKHDHHAPLDLDHTRTEKEDKPWWKKVGKILSPENLEAILDAVEPVGASDAKAAAEHASNAAYGDEIPQSPPLDDASIDDMAKDVKKRKRLVDRGEELLRDTDIDVERFLVDATLNALQARVGNIAKALRVTGDTVAGLTGGSIRAIGASAQGVASFLENTGDSLDTRKKEEEWVPPAWFTADESASNAPGGDEEAQKESKKDKKGDGRGSNPIKALWGLSRNTLADVAKIGGTTVRGFGDAVFQVGSVTESIASGTTQVAEDVVRVFELALGSMQTDIETANPRGGGGSGIGDLDIGDLGEEGRKQSADTFDTEESAPSEPLTAWDMVKWFFGSVWSAMKRLPKEVFKHESGVPGIAPHLAVVMGVSVLAGRKKWGIKKSIFILTALWMLVVTIDNGHRRRISWLGQSTAEQRWLVLKNEGAESMQWANHIMQTMWRAPGVGGVGYTQWSGLSAYMAETIWTTAALILQETAPTSVAKVEIAELYFGSTPPRITGVTVLKPSDAVVPMIRKRPTVHYAIDLDIASSDMLVKVLIKMSSLQHARLPNGDIRLQGVLLRARLIVSVEILPKYPFIGAAVVSFAELPEIDLRVAVQRIDVSVFGGADAWLRLALKSVFKLYTQPRFMSIDIGEMIHPGYMQNMNIPPAPIHPPTTPLADQFEILKSDIAHEDIESDRKNMHDIHESSKGETCPKPTVDIYEHYM